MLPPIYAQVVPQTVLNLPAPGVMVSLTPAFTPAMIKGINIYPENPLKFDFIIDRGDTDLTPEQFREESAKLIKYFLASLTVPEKEMWVNLSPYEKDRIIPEHFGRTEMGRDILAQDYMLKQLSSSLTSPDADLGKEFWNRIYQKAQGKFGTTDIPMNTFNKIWIVPEEATIYEHAKGAFVVKSHLKVMLEEDYLLLDANKNSTQHGLGNMTKDDLEIISGVSSQIVREILIPEIEKEVNAGKTFANLRQVYHSVILASWYKQALLNSLLGQIYVDKSKTDGVDVQDPTINQKIYDQYVEALKKGVFDFIKEDYDPVTQDIIPRKYFSGGVKLNGDFAMLPSDSQEARVAAAGIKVGDVVTVELAGIPSAGDTTEGVRSRLNRLIAAAAILSQCIGGACGQQEVPKKPEVDAKKPSDEIKKGSSGSSLDVNSAFDWIKSQIDPKTGLVKSFEGLPQGDISKGKTWIYNQAQAILVALARNDLKTAEVLVNGLLELNRKNGAWLNAYETADPSHRYGHWELDAQFVGANMAVGHALIEFLELNTDNEQLDQEVYKTLSQLAQWLDDHFNDRGEYGYVNDGDISGAQANSAKTEYNLRAFVFYDRLSSVVSKRGDIWGAGKYKKRANQIVNFIQNQMWNEKEGRYYTGLNVHGIDENPREAIYPNYFAVIAAHIAGRPVEEFSRGMGWVSQHKSTIKIEGRDIQGIARIMWLTEGDKRKLVPSASIWGKGTAEAAVAFELIGNHQEAQGLRDALTHLQSENGGVLEAVSDNASWIERAAYGTSWPVHFPYPSIEATAPLIIFGGNFDAKFIADNFELVLPSSQEQQPYLARKTEVTVAKGGGEANEEDAAMLSDRDETLKGGIDLNPTITNMHIQRDGNGVAFPVFDQPIENINVNGFVPVIINVTPLHNDLLLILGLSTVEGTKILAKNEG
jgi:hypothetical protein